MSEKTLIYVSVTTYSNPNTFSWFPVQSFHEHENCYRIIESSSDPEHEYWEFTLNDVVSCRNNKFAEGEFGLTVFEKCAHQIK
jgi:hypothetical protein